MTLFPVYPPSCHACSGDLESGEQEGLDEPHTQDEEEEFTRGRRGSVVRPQWKAAVEPLLPGPTAFKGWPELAWSGGVPSDSRSRVVVWLSQRLPDTSHRFQNN